MCHVAFFWNPQHPKSQWHSDCYIDFFWETFFDNPNGIATVTRASFGNFFWQSQRHSDSYTDFFWQSFLTIPMAQRLLHRLLVTIFFDNPNGTATVTQTSFDNLFPQSQWHSVYYTDFSRQSFLTIRRAQSGPYRFCWKPWYLKSQWHNDNYTDFFWQSFSTIPMAQRVPYSFVESLGISNPNGTTTIA